MNRSHDKREHGRSSANKMLASGRVVAKMLSIRTSDIPLLILDPARDFAAGLRPILQARGFRVAEVRSIQAALASARAEVPSVVFKPYLGTREEKYGAMEQLQALSADIHFIFIDPRADVRRVMDAVRRGAFDCLPWPCAAEQVLLAVERALEHQLMVAEHPEILRRLRDARPPNILAGQSAAMQRIQETIDRVADTDVTILLHGESGTGKELVARVLHDKSRRSGGPFVAVNCAALPDSLLESELFGHVKGAFTGALADKPGRFALAAGGTLFLDEIGDLSPWGQADLLRVLEDGMFRPIGSKVLVQANARVIAATNRNLLHLCAQGVFREDLYYRLGVIVLELPPLRERPEDVARLAGMFLQHFCARHARRMKKLTPQALEVLQNFSWPGNVRQLRNAVERAVLLAPRRELHPEDFPEACPTASSTKPQETEGSGETMREKQATWAKEMLIRCGGNRTRTAQRLKISRRTLQMLLAR